MSKPVDRFFEYVTGAVSFLDEKLALPFEWFRQYLVSEENVVQFVNTPSRLLAAFATVFVVLFIFSSDFLFNLIGFGYPVYYYLTTDKQLDNVQSTNLNKYWTIFGLIKLFEIFFWFVQYLPFVNYIKLGIIIFLTTKNFHYANTTYDLLVSYVDRFGFRNYLTMLFNKLYNLFQVVYTQLVNAINKNTTSSEEELSKTD